MKQPRNGGGRWRVNVVDKKRSHHISHNRNFGYDYFGGKCPEDSDVFQSHELPGCEFDELVVGHWCHIEMMDDNQFWMNIAGITINVTTDRNGKPTVVRAYGPGDYDVEVEGCQYGHAWSRSDELEA